MPYLACLPVGGASLANDDVMTRSECGVNKCGEALRSSLPQIRSSTRTNDPTSFDHTGLCIDARSTYSHGRHTLSIV